MNYFEPFLRELEQQPIFKKAASELRHSVVKNWVDARNGNLPRFLEILNRTDYESANNVALNEDVINIALKSINESTNPNSLKEELSELKPWRKGPFVVGDLTIDAEWRCDFKWQRIANVLEFKNRNVLDIGGGNGYYGLRCVGKKAKTVTVVDPSILSVCQFLYLNKFMNKTNVSVLPMTLEDIPENLPVWDIALSMGVLYHRKSPFEHLESIKNKLVPGGQLILETLVIKGSVNDILVPENRYAMMNNVYFFPSSKLLELWLRKTGFVNIRLIDETQTTIDEQRSTEWKPGTSLKDYLDPNDPSKTIEGHPAPIRAIIYAEKPDKETKLPRYRL